MNRQMCADVVVTGIGVIGPGGGLGGGLGVASPGNALASGPRRSVSDDVWLDVEAQLDPRGRKRPPPAAAYLLAATRCALADAGDCLSMVDEDRRGFAVGTNSAVSGLARTAIDGGAYDLSPARGSFSSVDMLAGWLPIPYAPKGFNLMVTSPRVAGLEAVEIGSRAVALGRSSLLLAGAVEAPFPAHGRHERGAGTAEAGAVALVVEPREAALARGATVYGSCRVRTFFVPPRLLESREGRVRAGLAVQETLSALRGASHEMPPVHTVLDDSAVSATVAAALRGSSDGVIPHGSLDAPRRPGGEGCLEPMLHVARLLAQGDRDRIVVIATAEGNGAFAQLSQHVPAGGPTDQPNRSQDTGAAGGLATARAERSRRDACQFHSRAPGVSSRVRPTEWEEPRLRPGPGTG
ncbi:MAG: beta-ketoacyl synthase N-terminal-like domain-containing protein [Egibacteraceae bacterium]